MRLVSADQIEEFLVAQPFAPLHRFIVHHGDMGCGSAKSGNTQLEK
jgi:hypothetical protein